MKYNYIKHIGIVMAYVDSLRVFARIIELGSITSGGRDLRMTPALASKRIKELDVTPIDSNFKHGYDDK